MTPERWAQIRQIFDGALERSEVDRAAYLRVVCARDDELRREVESLLASHDSAGDSSTGYDSSASRKTTGRRTRRGGYGARNAVASACREVLV